MVKEGPPNAATERGADTATSSTVAIRKAVRQYGEYITTRMALRVVTVGFVLLMVADTVAAVPGPVVIQTGLCGVPGGDTSLSLGMLIGRGILFVLGLVKVATALAGNDGGGDYGANASRVSVVGGLAIAAVGVMLPDLGAFVMTEFGTSPADIGLGCVF